MTEKMLTSSTFALILALIATGNAVTKVKMSTYVTDYLTGDLPRCQISQKNITFVTEVCNILRLGFDGVSLEGFRYCACPDVPCTTDYSLVDQFTFVQLGDLQLKTCVKRQHILPCSQHQGSMVAKIWYGELLPLRVLLYCACADDEAWAAPRCTSSGRICFVSECQKA